MVLVKKRAAAVLAAVLLTAGCKGEGVESVTPFPKQPQEKAELTIMHVDKGKDGFEAFIQEAEKRLGITIHVKECPDNADNRQAEIATILSSGDASVDVITVNDEMISEFKYKGYLTPLDAEVMTDEIKSHYPEEYLEDMCMADGRVYSVPFLMDVMVFWVNQELLDKAGMQGIETREDMEELSKRLDGQEIFAYGDAWEKSYVYNTLSQFINLFGGDYQDWSDSHTREAASYMKEMLDKGVTSSWQMVDQHEQMLEKFTSGKYGCIFMYSGSIRTLTVGGIYGKDKIHIAPLPDFGEKAVNIAAWQYVLNNASQNKEAAIRFLQYAASYEGSLAYAQAMNAFPARLDVIEGQELNIEGIEEIREYLKGASLCARPLCVNSMPAISSMGSAFQKYVIGELSDEQFYAQAQRIIDRYYEGV